MTNTNIILEINNLKTYFFLEKGSVKAVNGVNLTLERERTLGVVGESGCGKSITARSVVRLVQSSPSKGPTGQSYFLDSPPPVHYQRAGATPSVADR